MSAEGTKWCDGSWSRRLLTRRPREYMKKKIFTVIGIVCCGAGLLSASNITASSASSGTNYFATGPFNANQKASEVVGMTVTITYVSGSVIDTCAFAATGICATVVGSRTLASTTPASQNTSAALWSVFNTQAGETVSTVTFNGVPGKTVFNPCLTSGTPNFSGSGCAAPAGEDPGFGNSLSVSSHSGGLALNAKANYSDAVRAAGNVYLSDLYAKVVLTNFTGGSFTSSATAFTFDADTDQVTALTVDTPEPATYGLVGLALAGLGALKFRRRKV